MALFRFPPKMPVTSYKTYSLISPRGTHWRKATCAEVDCEAYLKGWVTKVDITSVLGSKQANYIRLHSGRSFVTSDEGGPIVTFTFPAMQKCFADHQVPVQREPICLVRDGDWRGNPTGRRTVHSRSGLWVEDFAEHQGRLSDEFKKGA